MTDENVDLEKENEQLKAQIEQLSNDNNVLKTAFFTQQIQIVKMKCCGNCKHLGIYFDEETETTHCCIYQNECHNYDKWELAE